MHIYSISSKLSFFNNEMTPLSERKLEAVTLTALVDPASIQISQQLLNAQIDVEKLIQLLRETAPKQKKKNCVYFFIFLLIF